MFTLGGIAMFIKAFSLALAAVLGYFTILSDFDFNHGRFFLLSPTSAILSYLILGAAD